MVVGMGTALAAPVAHVLDAEQIIGVSTSEWTEAASSETRRHLAQCFALAEAGLRDELGGGALAADVRKVPTGSVWAAIRDCPALLGVDLLSAMRVRATAGLLAREAGEAGSDNAPVATPDLSWLMTDQDPAVAAQANLLAMAEQRWSGFDRSGEAVIDLSDDLLQDLVWTAASLFGQALAGHMRRALSELLPAIVEASDRIVLTHRGRCPIEAATRLAGLVSDRAEAGAYLGQALSQRRLLPFAALAGEYLSLPADRLLQLLVHAPAEEIAGVCHALGGSPSDFQHLLMQLRAARASLTDAAVLAHVERYRDLSGAEAALSLARLRCPPGLRAKIDLAAMASTG